MESFIEASNNTTPGSICNRVPDDPPLNRTNGNNEETWIKGCKTITVNGVARITEANCRDNQPTKDAADKDEECVYFGAFLPRC